MLMRNFAQSPHLLGDEFHNANPSMTRRQKLLLLTASAWGVSACGSNEGSNSNDSRVSGLDYKSKAWFIGQALDSKTAAPLSGVSVYIPYGKGDEYTVTTGADGKYSLQVAIADLAGLGLWALKFYKEGYQPHHVIYSGPITGATDYGLRSEEGKMTALAANEYTSKAFANLIHLGDDNFGGSNNSQLQVGSTGLYTRTKVLDWQTSMNGQFRSATVSMRMRGVQGQNNNPVGFIALVNAQNGRVGSDKVMDFVTSSDGSYDLISYTTNLPTTVPDGAVSVYVNSGQSSSGDWDDFEYTGISVRLNP